MMATTFAAGLVADVKKQIIAIGESLGTLHNDIHKAVGEGDINRAQGSCAKMFALFPALLAGNGFLDKATQVDLDSEDAINQLIAPLILAALNHSSRLSEAYSNGPLGQLAHHFLSESLANMAKSIAVARDQFDKRVKAGEHPDAVLASIFQE